MKISLKILLSLALLFASTYIHAQKESYLQPFSNPLFLNPALAGYGKQSSVHIGNQFYRITNDRVFNLLYTSYDAYSPKLKGGVGVFMKQGLMGDQNISTYEVGMVYSGFPVKTSSGTLLFSGGTSLLLATKQWFAFTQDHLLVKPGNSSNKPGMNLLRYTMIKSRLGVLWDMPNLRLGTSATYSFESVINGKEDEGPASPLALSFYASGEYDGFRNGLLSRPFTFVPECLVFVHEDFKMSQFKASARFPEKTLSIFVRNNFTHSIHTLGVGWGLQRNYLNVSIMTGAAIPGISEELGYTLEFSLNIVLPPLPVKTPRPWFVKSRQ